MAYLLSLLPFLACPIMMGLMMWLMMRGGQKSDAPQRHVAIQSEPPKVAKRNTLIDMCLNWKVVAGLAVVGVGVWIVAPNLVWAAVPILLVLACPISMLFMMRGMGSGRHDVQPEQAQYLPVVGSTGEEQLADLRAQHAAITHEIADLEATRGMAHQEAPPAPRTTQARAKGRS